MRVLVTGAGGQLGRELARALGGHDAVLLDRAALDVTDADAVARAVDAAEPDAIVHAAAWTDVDACEDDPERAHLINVEGTRHVARAAGDALVVLVGTDYVFDGTLDRPYTEDDEPNPLQVYGRTKLEAEDAVAAAPRWVVARTAWVYGARRADGSLARNFISAILAATADGPIDVVDDQVGSPTSAHSLADALVALIQAGASGRYHVVDPGAVSRFALARAAVIAAGRGEDLVRPIHTADAPARPATRPKHAPLDTQAWRAAGFDPLPAWESALARAIDEFMEAM